MKKTLIFIFVFVGLGVTYPKALIHAQGADKTRSDYLFVLDQYSLNHDEYIKAKQNYRNHRNLASKNKALEAEKKVLLARNETLRTYLLLLKDALSFSKRPTQMSKEPVENLINVQLDFLADNKKKLLTANSIKDLDGLSLELEGRKKYLTNLVRLTRNYIYLGRLGFHFFEVREVSYKLLFMAIDKLGDGDIKFVRYSNDVNSQLATTLNSWEESSSSLGELIANKKWLKADWQSLEAKIKALESQLITLIAFNQDMISILEK